MRRLRASATIIVLRVPPRGAGVANSGTITALTNGGKIVGRRGRPRRVTVIAPPLLKIGPATVVEMVWSPIMALVQNL
jgi:hypothetical protein